MNVVGRVPTRYSPNSRNGDGNTRSKVTSIRAPIVRCRVCRGRSKSHTTCSILSISTSENGDGRRSEPRNQKDSLTLGAKLTILPHPFILKSALTTPPMRVPSISRLLFNNTAALSSKRTQRPSGRRTGFLQRTITARRTSPRCTLGALDTAAEPEPDPEPDCAWGEMGRARLTTQTISSPTLPHPLFTLFLRTLTHSTRS